MKRLKKLFINDAHEKFYYEELKEVRYQDVYHKAFCYSLGINDDTRRNINLFLESINLSSAELNFPSTPVPLLGFHG